MIDFWIFPLSTIWGAYQNIAFSGFFILTKLIELVNIIMLLICGEWIEERLDAIWLETTRRETYICGGRRERL